MGRKKRPIYAIVAADARSPRDGRYIEDLGRYAPLDEPATMSLKNDRILHWLEAGAQPSDTVRSLLSKEGIMLALHMRRKEKSADEITAAVTAHQAARAEKASAKGKMTAAERREKALKDEEKRAAEKAAELAKERSLAAAKAKEEAEAAAAAAEAERESAAAEARAEQEAANAAQAAEDAPAAEA
ncbi:MAG: 30S ribosomal protein S16, partial [Bacteroidetes Order II. Incertae sedis bacterium]|nr:30S ribosomal protein S16 [Bacteroidetes Order II. bacterium]